MRKNQIFLLQFAGGNCYSYQFLERFFSKGFEVHALELPGRGKRIAESCFNTLDHAIEDYFNQVRAKRSKMPYIIYGHSMGALMGLFVTKKLETINDPPIELIVTGNAGPKIGFDKKTYMLPDNRFKEEIRKLGGTPEEVIENQEIYDFFSPILRADLEILERTPLPNIQIKTGIHAIMGNDERHQLHIKEWCNHTKGNVKCEHMPGGHFFILKHAQKIVEKIEQYA